MLSTFGDVVRSIPSYILPFFTVTCTTHPYKNRYIKEDIQNQLW